MYVDYIDTTNTVSDVKAINNSIQNILATRRGSVPGKPTFGSDLYTIVFDTITHLTESAIENIIFSAISEFEPRIVIQKINIKSIPEYNKVTANLEYKYLKLGIPNTGNVAITLKG